jgi:hypothetical protein
MHFILWMFACDQCFILNNDYVKNVKLYYNNLMYINLNLLICCAQYVTSVQLVPIMDSGDKNDCIRLDELNALYGLLQ